MFFIAINAFKFKATNFTGVTIPLTSIALFDVIFIPEVLNSNCNVAKFDTFVNIFKVLMGENSNHIEWHFSTFFFTFHHGSPCCREAIFSFKMFNNDLGLSIRVEDSSNTDLLGR